MSIDTFCSTIANQLNTGVLIVDLDFKIVKWNRFLEIHTNKKPENVLAKCLFETFPELPKKWFERKVASVVQLKSPSFCSWEQRHHLFKLPHTRPITTDSKFMAQNVTFLPIEAEGIIDHICVLIEDVTDVCHYQSMLRKTLDELAMLDDRTFEEEQKEARELSSNLSAQKAHDEINGTRKKKRSLLSRVLPFGLLRGTFRSGGRSDYL